MMSDDEHGWHRRIAVEQFNRTWELIDRADRSAEDDQEMLLAAATSRWHWAQIGGPENLAAGDWQLAHVASLLGHDELALTFARQSLAVAEAQGWRGWRLASAHEGMARACAGAGDRPGRDQHLAAARAALDAEEDADSAQLINDQLATVPD